MKKKNKELLEKLLNPEDFYAKKQQNRAGWALVILTIIAGAYFFVWAWTNF